MKLVGLTGSIGMGKSTAAQMLRRMGLPVFDADAEVHKLLGAEGRAVTEVEQAFPGVLKIDGGVDRLLLGTRVFGDSMALRRLESILHPKVHAARKKFIASQRRHGADLVILDIPLLFESGGNHLCDAVLVVTAPYFLQKQRVLKRAGMTEEKFRNILAKQVPDREKRRRTPYIVDTGLGKRYTKRLLKKFIQRIRQTRPEKA